MESVIKEALKNQAVDYIEVRLEQTEGTVVSYAGPELDTISTRTERGGNVRACHKGGWSLVTFNDWAELKSAVSDAAQLARKTGTGKTELAPVPVVHETGIITAYTTDPRTIPLEQKEHICRTYNQKILAGTHVQTSKVVYKDYAKNLIFANSEGSYIDHTRIFTGAAVVVFASDGGSNVQQAYESWGDYHGWENMDAFPQKTENAIKTAQELIKADKVAGGVYTCVLDSGMTGLFTHEAFGHLSEADFLYENKPFQEKMKLDRRFGEPILNIVDQGDLTGECGYIAYDDEGVKSRKNYLIKEGILAGRLHNRETAAKLGEAVTGNARAITYQFSPIVRMTNTFIEPGTSTVKEMIESIDSGLYVVGELGGSTDLEKFAFAAQKAYTIKNGKLGTLVRDTVLSGNVFETLANIDMVSNESKLIGGLGGCGKNGQMPLPVSLGGPHIRVKNVLIGGK